MATITGTSGNDLISKFSSPTEKTTDSADTVYAGFGHDKVFGAGGNDRLYGYYGDDILYGENGNDVLYGESDDDILYGGNNNDILYGQSGDDLLIGENGDDKLAGAKWTYSGAELDTLTGGSGSDQFYLGTSQNSFYTSAGNNDYALITDFQPGVDQIKVTAKDIYGQHFKYRLEGFPSDFGMSTRVYIDRENSADQLIGLLEGVNPIGLGIFQGNSYTTIKAFPIDLF